VFAGKPHNAIVIRDGPPGKKVADKSFQYAGAVAEMAGVASSFSRKPYKDWATF